MSLVSDGGSSADEVAAGYFSNDGDWPEVG